MEHAKLVRLDILQMQLVRYVKLEEPLTHVMVLVKLHSPVVDAKLVKLTPNLKIAKLHAQLIIATM